MTYNVSTGTLNTSIPYPTAPYSTLRSVNGALRLMPRMKKKQRRGVAGHGVEGGQVGGEGGVERRLVARLVTSWSWLCEWSCIVGPADVVNTSSCGPHVAQSVVMCSCLVSCLIVRWESTGLVLLNGVALSWFAGRCCTNWYLCRRAVSVTFVYCVETAKDTADVVCYRMLIGNRPYQAFESYHFQWCWVT